MCTAANQTSECCSHCDVVFHVVRCRLWLFMSLLFSLFAGYFRDSLQSYDGLLHAFTCANTVFAFGWVLKIVLKRRRENSRTVQDSQNRGVVVTPLNTIPTWRDGETISSAAVRACCVLSVRNYFRQLLENVLLKLFRYLASQADQTPSVPQIQSAPMKVTLCHQFTPPTNLDLSLFIFFFLLLLICSPQAFSFN